MLSSQQQQQQQPLRDQQHPKQQEQNPSKQRSATQTYQQQQVLAAEAMAEPAERDLFVPSPDSEREQDSGTYAVVDPLDVVEEQSSVTDGSDSSLHAPISDHHKFRVKLYEMDGQMNWVDKGTGICTVAYIEAKDCLCLLVRSEFDSHIVMENPIVKEDVYQRQQSSLIVWTELDGVDLALSFQDEKGCNEIWENIADVQQRLRSLNGMDIDAFRDSQTAQTVELTLPTFPELELNTLAEFDQKFNEVVPMMIARDKLVVMVMEGKIVDKLCDLFEMAEDMDMKAELVHIFHIMKSIVMLSEYAIFEYFLEDHLIMRVCGIFEYDPEYSVPVRKYRDFIGDQTRFKRIGSFNDAELEKKIHQTFRAQFLKDVVLARIIEEAHFSVLSSIVVFNHVDILNAVSKDENFLKKIFEDLRNSATPRDRQKTILLFIQDFCNIAKNLQTVNRQGFYRALAGNGILQELTTFLADSESEMRMISADILSSILEHEAPLIRSFVLAQKKHQTETLTEMVIRRLIVDDDEGMKFQYVEILRLLLDWSSEEPPSDQESTDFLHLFYNEEFPHLVKPIKELQLTAVVVDGKEVAVLNLSRSQVTVCTHIVELICFFVRMHRHRIKFQLLSGDLLQKAALFFKCPNTSLKLAAVRLFRTLVGTADEFYLRFIAKQNLLKNLIEAFVENGEKYNMLNSACLELFEYARNEDVKMKTMINYLVETARPILESITYVQTGKKLVLRYDQMHDTTRGTMDEQDGKLEMGGNALERPERRAWGSVDQDEEAYFNDTDEQQATPGKTTQDTSFDDENHLPSLRKSTNDDDEEDMFEKRLNMSRRHSSNMFSGKKLPRASGFLASAQPSRKIVFAPGAAQRKEFGVAAASEEKSPRKGYGLVDYDDDDESSSALAMRVPLADPSSSPTTSMTPTKRTASSLSPLSSPPFSHSSPPRDATPTKIRSLTMGAKRMAIDDTGRTSMSAVLPPTHTGIPRGSSVSPPPQPLSTTTAVAKEDASTTE